MVQAQNQMTDRFVASAAVNLNQFLDRFGQFVLPGVVFLQFLVKGFVGQQARLARVEHGQLRVEAQFMKMFAHELEAETVERADVRGVEQRELLHPARFIRLGANFFLKLFAQPPAHFGGGGLGEGDHENFLERSGRLFRAQAVQTALDQRVGFARARAGHDQHVAARGDRLLL